MKARDMWKYFTLASYQTQRLQFVTSGDEQVTVMSESRPLDVRAARPC